MDDTAAKPLRPAVWLAEAQSSQRDMLESLQLLKVQTGADFEIIASHRSERPEIFEFADTVYYEPIDETPRWQFVLDKAIQHNVKVLLTGRNGHEYEAEREAFTQAGIRLLTGALSVEDLADIEDKFAFTQRCKTAGIAVADSWRFDTAAELNDLLSEHGGQPLCVKPIVGIFAQGFWRLDSERAADTRWDSFEHLYYTEEKKITTEQFVSAYTHSDMVQTRPIPMLLMPYLDGQEYSIDIVCEAGEVLAAITRYKTGKIQHIGYDDAVMSVVKTLIREFGCDGIVSVQTKADKADDEGRHHVLEINSRPSGGIGYTNHSGLDLTQVAFAYWLGLSDKPILDDVSTRITSCQVRSIMVSVKI
ncbi:ATP-grasp domain-containing protein [Psychrobacter aestuarii]|uniref:ATP-grasp domain-containing protein n=1 Tax=Psychrobacter aestuarii TaxID=556327 RepID=A0ABP3FC59_9GAMM|nr:ATP-grasp domain-containing protein [Psychrobacter aestuarii]